MGVVDAHFLEVQKEVQSDVRAPFLDGLAQGEDLVSQGETAHVVAEFLQGRQDVVLGLERQHLCGAQSRDRLGRDRVLMQQGKDAQAFHRR